MYAPHDHAESIYNLVPPTRLEPLRPPMYRSKHSWSRPASASTFHGKSTTHPFVSNISGDAEEKIVADKEARLFGKPNGYSRNDPSRPLTKGYRSYSVPTLREVKLKNPGQLQPKHARPSSKGPTPRAHERPLLNIVTGKNFIVANAVDVMLAAPRRPMPEGKDYYRKEDYGKIPKYLEYIKKDIRDERDYISAMAEDMGYASRPQVQPLEETERVRLIEGLKKKWEQVNHDYQKHTHLTKLEAGKILRKEMWDAELQNLEKDIEVLNKRNVVIDMAS